MRKPSRILIIDDEPSVCGLLKRLLTSVGYEVSTSNDGQEGLLLSRSQFFHVVILDICLPGTDGLLLLSKIKDFSPATEVIMITGNWTIETSIQAFELGAYDYIMKPIDSNHLFQVVEKATQKQALEFERKHLIAEIEFKNALLEEQKVLLEEKLIEDDQRIFRLIKEDIFIKTLFEEMIESLPLGVMVVDKNGQVLMCNKVNEIFSGLPKDSLIGKNLFKDPLPADLKPWHEMGKNFLSRSAYEVKVIDERPEKKRVLSITLSSLVNETGDSWGFIFLSADITKEKRIEGQIIQAEKMTAIGQLVTSLAHQIRNPLAIVMSATQCCIEKVEQHENGLRKYYEIICRNIRNADKIISDLLDFAKPKLLEFREHDVNRILEEICRLVRVDFSKNRIRILKRFEKGLPKILCDKESLRQAFFNLFINSKQAMPKGGCLSLATSYNPKDQTVRITIRDTGHGIPKEHLARIFDPYFTTKEGGTGLGLSIVHRIISEHCGGILPESEDGEGTTMTISLPAQSTNLVTEKVSVPEIHKDLSNPWSCPVSLHPSVN